MIELQGKYNSAKIFTDVVDQNAISQVFELLNQEFVTGSRIRMMPDIHAGAGCTIGTTMTIKDRIVPNLVGVDIGCGMYTVTLEKNDLDVKKLDSVIRDRVPSGANIRETPHANAKKIDLSQLRCAKHINSLRAENSIGTLGGGNHFIEVDVGDDGKLYLIIHSGSRHLGLEVANYYQEAGYKVLDHKDDACIKEVIAIMKASGCQKHIQKALEVLKKTHYAHVPKALAYVSGRLFDDYIHDMKIVQQFADLNRKTIAAEILQGMGLHAEDAFSTVHNYIDTDAMILRKGAVSAKAGEKLLIPINMRDGSLLCVGKGNEDWNYSAPHGAGRLMSRAQAKESFTVEEFQKQMDGIYTTSACQATLDECPMAYKAMNDIVDNIGPTAEVLEVLRPIYNFKANDA